MSQPLLKGEVEYVEAIRVDIHSERITELEDQVASLHEKMSNVKRDAIVAVLTMLSEAMRHVASGKMDIPEPPTAAAPQFDQRWEAWKQKLGAGTAPARVIDALLKQGPLNRTQLRQFGELGWSTLDAATSRLKNLNLIEKSGDRWILKQL